MTTAQELLSKSYAKVGLDDTIAQLIGKLKSAKQGAALVFDGDEYAGIIDKHFLANSHIDSTKMKVRNAISHRSKGRTPFFVPTLAPADDLLKISKLMTGAGTNLLAVVEKNKVLGVVHANDVLLAAANEYKGITCEKLATGKPLTCKPDDPVSKAIAVLNLHRIDHLPVVDGSGTLIGMIGMTDILGNDQLWNTDAQHISQAANHQGGKRSGYAHGEKTSLLSLPVKNFMTKKNTCCTKPDTTIPNAVEQMCENGVCSIILVKNNKPVGIMTVRDVIKDYAKS